MTLRLNRSQLRGELQGTSDKPPTFRKPPTTTKRVNRLKKILHHHIDAVDVDATVMAIAMTGIDAEVAIDIVKAGFTSTQGSDWRKMEHIYTLLQNPELSVIAMEANLSYAEVGSLLSGDNKVNADTLKLMSKLQRRSDNSHITPKGENKNKELSQDTLRRKMGNHNPRK